MYALSACCVFFFGGLAWFSDVFRGFIETWVSRTNISLNVFCVYFFGLREGGVVVECCMWRFWT